MRLGTGMTRVGRWTGCLVGLALAAISAQVHGQDPAFEAVAPMTNAHPGVTTVELADLDGDGDLDTLAGTGTSGQIIWFENDGDRQPSFPKVHTITGAATDARTATAVDLDGDGDLDVLATASAASGRVVWYRNEGGLAPSFTPVVMGVVSPGDLGARVNAAHGADLDGDTDMDVVVSFYLSPQQNSGHVVWFENDGSIVPSFQRHPLSAPSGELENVADIHVADLDGNGAPDIVAVSETPGTPLGSNRVVWWKSTGGANPTFAYNVIEQALADPVSVHVTNLGGDPSPDIVVCAPGSDLVGGFINSGGANPTFSLSVGLTLNDPRDVESFDEQNDGDQDLVVALGSDQRVALFENFGGAQPSFGYRPLESAFAFCDDVSVGDIDGNGKVDVVAAYTGQGTIRRFQHVTPIQNVFQNSFHASFADAVQQASPGDGLIVDSDRLYRDPQIDLLGKQLGIESDGAFVLGDRSSLLLADGAALSAPTGQPMVLDGIIDVPAFSAVSAFGDSGMTLHSSLELPASSYLFGTTDLTMQGRREMSSFSIDGDAAVGSFDNWIGKPIDSAALRVPSGTGFAVIGGEIGGPNLDHPAGLAVYYPDAMSPTGWSGKPLDADTATCATALATGDFNNDGLDDIIFTDTCTGAIVLRVLLAQSENEPTYLASTGATGGDAQHLVPVDIDFDGDLDVVSGQGIYYNVDPVSATFLFDPFPLVSGLRSFGVVAADFDLDGGIDVAVHCEKLGMGSGGRVGYSLYVMWSDGAIAPSFTPVLIEEADYVADGTCDGQADCYPIVSIELDGLNTLSREDQNKDGFTDFFMSDDSGIRLFTNLVDSPPVFQSTTIDSGGVYCNVTPIDIERDGDIDLFCASQRASRVDVLLNDAGTNYVPGKAIRPLLRASDVSVLGIDREGVAALGVIASGCDRVDVVTFGADSDLHIRTGAFADILGQVVLDEASITLEQGALTTSGTMIIGPEGVLQGEGTVAASVQNVGQVRPLNLLEIFGNYAHRSPFYPGEAGALEVGLRSVNDTDLLQVTGTLVLTGGLRAEAGPNFVPSDSDVFTVITSDDIDNGTRFTAVTTPSLSIVDQQGQVTTGSLMPEYNDVPGSSTVDLGAFEVVQPVLGRDDFNAIATPADAVVMDITGGPSGEPDGYADTIIAYPTLPNQPQGGIGVFIGAPGADSRFDFESLTIYSDEIVINPVAVEAGDYDGDGDIEIASGNSRDFSESTVFILEADSSLANPIFPSQLPPLILRPGGVITDMTTADVMPTPGLPARGFGQRRSIVVLTDYEDSGVATAASIDNDGWDGCDIDVCDDPDSTDPIDVDGAAATLIEGYAATSKGDNKVVVAANPAASPGMFITLDFDVGEGPTEIRAGDLNLDGFPDLVNINEISGTVSVLTNITDMTGPGGRNFDASVELSLRSEMDDPDPLPSSVALADIDEDGDLDVAVVSTNGSGERVVRQLLNLYVETGTLTFSDVEDLSEQPVGTPLLVRSGDLEGDSGGMQLADDLVVYVDPNAETLGRPAEIGVGGHASILSDDPDLCLADVNGDGAVTPADFSAWINAFNNNLPECDQNGDGLCTPGDFSAWIANFNAGCP